MPKLASRPGTYKAEVSGVFITGSQTGFYATYGGLEVKRVRGRFICSHKVSGTPKHYFDERDVPKTYRDILKIALEVHTSFTCS